MSAGIERRMKRILQAGTAALLALAVSLCAYGAGTVPVLEQELAEDSLRLYLKYDGGEGSAQAQIGTQAVGEASIAGSGSFPVSTWLLLDNSLSISAGDRQKAKELLTNLAAGGGESESFTLCTYDEHLRILLRDSQSYADLKSQIDAVEHVNQESFLTDALAELLDEEESREEPAYVRVIVICDGVDNNPQGLTREELNSRLASRNIPVYTLGCETGDNDALLKELYALSRRTGAQSWSLSGLTDTLEVVRAMGGAEMPVCAVVPIPEELRDGGTKGVRLTFEDGSTAEAQAVMPFGEAAEAQPEPEEPPVQETAAPVQPEPESGLPAALIIGGGAAAAAVAAAVVIMGKKRKRERIQPVEEPDFAPSGLTDVLSAGWDHAGQGGTLPLVGGERAVTLSLQDLSDPNRYFEVPLRGRASIGRGASNQIVLDYERSVSGTHCEIFAQGDGFFLRDLGSSNGTYLDGVRVADTVPVQDGSVIKLGRLELRVGIR